MGSPGARALVAALVVVVQIRLSTAFVKFDPYDGKFDGYDGSLSRPFAIYDTPTTTLGAYPVVTYNGLGCTWYAWESYAIDSVLTSTCSASLWDSIHATDASRLAAFEYYYSDQFYDSINGLLYCTIGCFLLPNTGGSSSPSPDIPSGTPSPPPPPSGSPSKPSSSNSPPSTTKKKKKQPLGAIIGGTLGIFALASASGALSLYLCKSENCCNFRPVMQKMYFFH